MKRLTYLFCLSLFSISALFAQKSGYVVESEKTEISEEETISEKLDSLNQNYNFRGATSSTYDTLIMNVKDYQKEEIPKFSDEVLQRRLQDIPSLVPLDYNVYVKRYIEMYTLQRREQVSRMMGLARVYFPIFEEELDRRNMPLEIKYLAVVESALNPHARSRVGATGLWQFMLSTGRLYGLRVNSFVDERKNPYKATEAACKYLQRAYDEFGDWMLAIASYNCGEGNVRKAIRRSGGKKNFWAIRRYLPRETRGYVPALIAATYVFNYAPQHNLYPIYVNFDHNVDTLHIKGLDIRLSDIAEMTNTPVDILRNLNPELKQERIPYTSRTYVLRVPRKVSNYFASFPISIRDKYGKKQVTQAPTTTSKAKYSYHSAAPHNPGNGRLHIHKVKEGEVVGAIAEAYGVSARNISYWNNLYRYRIRVGQKLKIYSNKTPKAVKSAEEYKPKAQTQVATGPGTYHKVRRGDTIWSIAKEYDGVSTQSILALNKGIKASDLKPGQQIRVK